MNLYRVHIIYDVSIMILKINNTLILLHMIEVHIIDTGRNSNKCLCEHQLYSNNTLVNVASY